MENISILEAARALGRSKNTVKYWVRKLPPETLSKDERGRTRITADGLEILRGQLGTLDEKPDERNHQEPDERTTGNSAEPLRTGRKPPKNHQKPDEEPDEKPVSTGRKPDENHLAPDEEPPTTTQAQQLEALRAELDSLRSDLYAERERAAVAAAERDAERRRADAAELREQQQAQTVKDLTAALTTAQKQAADLTAALTAAQALHAGTIRGQLETAAPAPTAAGHASKTAAGAETVRSNPQRMEKHTAAPPQSQRRPQTGTKQRKRGGLFAKLFGK